MKLCIIIGPDPAGQNIKHFLLALHVPFQEIFTKVIFAENIDEKIPADIFIFATTHKSAQGIQSLTVHFPGNFGNAELGGKEKELCIAPASLLKELYLSLKSKYSGEVSIEATHHGPFLRKPAVFLEIGSSEDYWKDTKLGELLAEVLSEVLLQKRKSFRTVAVLGGGHYSPEVNKILFGTNYAVGHFCPKHALKNLDGTMLLQMFQRAYEKVEAFALDWKGMGEEKNRILSLLEKHKLPYVKVKDITSHTSKREL